MERQRIATFEQAVRYIDEVPRFTSKHTMAETKRFLHRLGDPDRKLRIVHVAGTNGKGSVCAYLRSILEAAGYRVALFTSPHLVCIRERFVVDGEMVSEEDFLRAFRHIYDLLDWDALERGMEEEHSEEGAYHPTYFEYLFFIAMVLFEEEAPDFCILETGVGGRLDATNAVSHKELTVITHIGLDHVGVLGDTLGKIAYEKAGILRPGVPAVWWDTCEETTEVFRKRAEELGILSYSVSENDYSFSNFKRKTIDFCVDSQYYKCIPLTLHTIAAYQRENCTLAIRGIEALDQGRTITAQQIQAGVSGCFWAGRMEEVLPEVYVDGAHNEDGIRAFLETVAADGHDGARSLLFSVVKDKDYRQMAERLEGSGLFGRVAVAHMHGYRALDRERLKGLFIHAAGSGDRFLREEMPGSKSGDCVVRNEGAYENKKYAGCVPEVYDTVENALVALLQERQTDERIYAAGSLYLVGEIKELLDNDQFRRRIEKISSQP